VRQVVVGVGRGGRGGHAPVDADAAIHGGGGLDLAVHDERGVPVTEVVAVDADGGRLGGQGAGPHDWDADALGQDQSSLTDGKPAFGVLDARMGDAGRLECRPAAAADLERVVQCQRERAQFLLLSNLRALPQPIEFGALGSQPLRQQTERESLTGAQPSNGVIPQVSGSVPFGDQRIDRSRAGAQAVGVAHGLFHAYHYTGRRYIVSTWSKSDPATASSTGAPTTSSGAPSTADLSSRTTLTTGSRNSSARCAQSASATSSTLRRCPI